MKPEPRIIRAPFHRLDAEKHVVFGFASTGRLDTYDTIFEPSWWPHAIEGYLQDRTLTEMHEADRVIGTVPILEVDDKGLWIGAEIQNTDTWNRIVSGEYNGFSIEAIPYKYREEYEGGKSTLRFTRFFLTGITVGYPVANLDAVFQYVERLAYDADSAWDWDWTKDADAIVAQMGWNGLAQACLYQDPSADPATKTAYKLPVAKLKAGELTVYWNGVRAAMAVLNGGRGGLDISEEDRKKAYSKIKKLYKKFDKEPPELRLGGGIIMSKFAEKISDLVKRLTGKDPDAATTQEITRLEQELATEQATKVAGLEDTVGKLETRLKSLEEQEAARSAAGDQTKQLTDLSAKSTDFETRLKAVETRLSGSKQPGEGNEPVKRTTEGGDVFAGVLFGD